MPRAFYWLTVSLLLAASPAQAAIHIAPECRVKNRPPGRCGWCALETLARHHGLNAIYGFAARHPCMCSPRSLEESLLEAGVRYRIQYPGNRGRGILHYAIDEELGAAIGLRGPSVGPDGHIVTLVDLTPDKVRYLDPNDADGRTRTMSLRRFLLHWDGLAIVLVPGGKWVSHPCRSRATTAAIRRPASSISATVNRGLRLKRIAERSTASGTSIACSTGEGSSEPLEQADPVEQATPARSRFISITSAFSPGNDRLMVCGRPFSGPLSMRGAAVACS